MEEKKLYVRDTDTIQEFATFVSKGQSLASRWWLS